MNFRLLNKNNIGVVVTLFLVILLSQSRFFDFLMETLLGRLALLGMIGIVSYSNKILGLFAVLAIMLAFNHYDSNGYRFEGFTDSQNKLDMLKAKEDELAKLKENALKRSTDKKEKEEEGREGFCLSDKEINMLRGKQSNTIPVFNNTRDQDDNVGPSDNSIFSDTYATF